MNDFYIFKSRYLAVHLMSPRDWSFGIGITSDGMFNPRQVYLYINLYRWSLYLGNLADIEPEE